MSYYIREAGAPSWNGPLETSQVQEMLKDGRVTPDHEIFEANGHSAPPKGDEAGWVRIGNQWPHGPNADVRPAESAPLRPAFLGVVTIVGILGSTLGLLGSLLAASSGGPGMFVVSLMCAASLAIMFALRQGYYWAWCAIQVLWSLNVMLSLFQTVMGNPMALVGAIIAALLLAYVRSADVREFCSVGKRRE